MPSLLPSVQLYHIRMDLSSKNSMFNEVKQGSDFSGEVLRFSQGLGGGVGGILIFKS